MENNEQKQNKIDYNVKEILDNLDKAKKNSQEDKKHKEQVAKASLAFEETIENIDISDESFKIIFTDGDQQLLYDNGEFFIISTTDYNKLRNKKKRSEAKDLYVEYFIKYQLNPMLKQKQVEGMIKTIVGKENVEPKKDNLKDKLKSETHKEKSQAKENKKSNISKEKEDNKIR